MSDRFIPIPLPKLVATALKEIRKNQFLGIPGSLFFIPSETDPFRMERYGRLLETPVGVAAGPHTQLAVNIIAAWLCGARYIELKTIQTLDELEVSKPCIDMQDEGYNCEWSQELKIEQSFNEYLNAWIIIHILRNELKFDKPLGTLFNMSAGYNMEGMLKDNVQWFLSKMMDCSKELQEAKNSIRNIYPEIDSLEIPSCISDHITLSTMHGCPPEEIEKIGLYLIKEKKLHTTIKLNPTLLGPEKLRFILNEKLGFETDVPDLAFEHDLKYPDAISMIKKLSAASDEEDRHFSVKLSNTLESRNHKSVFSEKESMMYMSGRALHPISITLAAKLQEDFDGKLDISFSAGADCYNLGKILASGMKPVTVCSDLLKPGGYGRLWQYFEQLRAEMSSKGANSIDEFILSSSDDKKQGLQAAALQNLKKYAARVADEDSYKKRNFTDPSIKTVRLLGALDCIHAPCKDTCPTHQDIPNYLRQVANGDIDGAFETVYMTNPFPTVTGMICDHPCQLKCTRINYDSALHIRDVKRYIAENGKRPNQSAKSSIAGYKVAVIGAGPAGLSSAYYLRKAGIEVTVFEKKPMPGGMVSAAIPIFRLTDPSIAGDIDEILSSGVKLVDNYEINESRFEAIRNEYSAVFLSAGAQNAAGLRLEGIENAEAFNVLDFLYSARTGSKNLNGKKVLIIGGGNTAMDAARTAFRMVGAEGKVTIVYRRTKKEMPADKGEIKAVLEEGIEILELTAPEKVIQKEAGKTSLLCSKNVLAMKGKDGRAVPIKVPDSEFEISFDILIPAIGQELAIDFIDQKQLITEKGSYKTLIPGLYIGGDAMRGASTAINAIGDGRLAAEEMIRELGIASENTTNNDLITLDINELKFRKSIRTKEQTPHESSLLDRANFNLVMETFSTEQATAEASRCLSCDQFCSVCVSVCPNLANFTYQVTPKNYKLFKAVAVEGGNPEIVPDEEFTVDQPYQVMNIRDLCNECANCVTFCPSAGKPYQDKPGISLSMESFNLEEEGYFLSKLQNRTVLIHKHHSRISTLSLENNLYTYETDQVRAVLDTETLALKEVRFLTACVKEYRFSFAAEMSIILKGAMQLPF